MVSGFGAEAAGPELQQKGKATVAIGEVSQLVPCSSCLKGRPSMYPSLVGGGRLVAGGKSTTMQRADSPVLLRRD